MNFIPIFTIVALCLGSVLNVHAQAPVSPPEDSPYRTDPVEPFRIFGNIHFVGVNQHNVSYLITTPAGNILIDTIFEESVPKILDNIKKLGHNPADIKLILTAHAHRDHVGGHALMQEETGGQILAPEEDANAIRTGGKNDHHSASWTPAKVDRIFKDGEQISLGGTVLTAHLTPGHTPGCTTWTMQAEEGGQKYNVVFVCGVKLDVDSLIDNPEYPDIARDLAGSFKTLKSLPADVFLGSHGYWYDLGGKIERMKKGEGNQVFIDPEGYRKAIDGWQQQFIERVVSEATAKK